MSVTGAELERQAVEHAISEWRLHECSGCGYRVGYLFGEGIVAFDSGCWCSAYGVSDPSPRTWDDVAGYINMQTNEDVIARYREFWHLPPAPPVGTEEPEATRALPSMEGETA